jgi:serine protease
MVRDMNAFTRLLFVAALVTAFCAYAAPAQVVQPVGAAEFDDSDFTDRMIVKFKGDVAPLTTNKRRADLSAELEEISGVKLEFIRDMANGALVMRLPQVMTVSEVKRIASRISANAAIDYAEPDQLAFPMLVPNDSLYAQQWHLNDFLGGINAPLAWDISTGSASVVVAVLDTGITTHPDLDSRIVPGYDFVTDIVRANDGDARDADASDPGDWITDADKSITQFADCTVRNSNWHGTMVAGAIGAVSQNGIGGVGIDWNARILPVRVLGKCGGFTSDIADGMLWAAGQAVFGVPENANPAKVINMSLGSRGSCSTTYQRTIDQLVGAGKIIVVSAGNSNLEDNGSLSTCRGVVNVAATSRAGSKASYSNFGRGITIAAPGGDTGGTYVTTGNTGTTTPGQAGYVGTTGTSFAAPTVSGVIGLMLALRPELDSATAIGILQATARPFPDATCTTALCGAGILDAAAALRLTRDQALGVASFISFADADVGRPNADVALKITNYATDSASASAAVSGGADFSISSNGCAGFTISRGAACEIRVRFNPTVSGSRSATLNIATTAGSFALPLQGTGYATAELVQRSAGKVGGPLYIARTNDNTLWYTNSSGNSIARVTPDGTLTEFALPTAAAGPFDIVAGPDGNVWFTELDANRIGRISPSGTITEFPIPTASSQPRGIAVGPDGNIWFTQIAGAKIGRITPAGVITEFTIPWASASPRGIAAGPDGNLWFTDSGARVIGRVSTSGVFTSFTIPWSSADARAITAGPDGNMWFVELTGNRLGRVSMSGSMTAFALPMAGTGPLGISSGPGNSVWFSGSTAGRIGRIDIANGQITEYRMPTRGSSPTGLVADANGNLWVTANAASSVVAFALNGVKAGLLAANSRRSVIDLDGTGQSPMLMRNPSGALQVARLSNGAFQFSSMAGPTLDTRLLGAGDFNGDGRSDLAFQNTVQDPVFGDVRSWSGFDQSRNLLWRQVKKVWDVQAIGDLDGDGFTDLVWRYVVSDSPDTGVSYIWFSNGAGVSQVRKRGGAPLNWTLFGAFDLNDDGAADMVYISPDNAMRALMATPNRTCANLSAGSIPSGFTALRIGDFSGRRKGDLLIRNDSSGEVRLLQLDAGGLTLPPYTGAPDDQNASCTSSTLTVSQASRQLSTSTTGWRFHASGDFNGDGITDIVWQRADGSLTVWLMNPNGVAPTVVSNAGTVPFGSTPLPLQ